MGGNYSRAFAEWIKRHHFDAMPKATRSVALELNENITAIEAWRATLTDKQRRRCVHPLSNVRAWRKAVAPARADCAGDDLQTARALWRRCVALAETLPADQASPFWRDIHEHATRQLSPK